MLYCTKNSTLLVLETAAVFSSPFSVYGCPSRHRREHLSAEWAEKGEASPDKMPLTSGSCHLPSTLTKPTLPVLHAKLHVAAALSKWEVQCVIILHLSFSRNPEPKPSKHQSCPCSVSNDATSRRRPFNSRKSDTVKKKSNLKRADPAQAVSKQGLWTQGRIKSPNCNVKTVRQLVLVIYPF